MKGTFSRTSTSSGPSPWPAAEYEPLGRVIAAPGAVARLGEVVRSLGCSRVLLVTDPGLERTGHPQSAERSMLGAGVTVATFDGVKENPTELEVIAGVAVARAAGIDCIVAVGGGSSLDCAKGINFLLTNGGKMSDYKGHGKATKPMLPSVGIPTTSGTGSEAQSYALITDASSHMKMACGDKKAAFRVSILDPELTLSQPKMVTSVTGIDAVAHAVESLVCTKANPFSRTFSLAAWRHLEPNFETVLREPDNLAARAEMQIGSHFAGMAIEGAMLGTAIGMLLPHVIRFNARVAGDTSRRIATDAEALARRIAAMVRAAELPASLQECGVSKSILGLMAVEANEQWTARFNPRPVGESEILSIYRAAW